jgi:hypothetical protein
MEGNRISENQKLWKITNTFIFSIPECAKTHPQQCRNSKIFPGEKPPEAASNAAREGRITQGKGGRGKRRGKREGRRGGRTLPTTRKSWIRH